MAVDKKPDCDLRLFVWCLVVFVFFCCFHLNVLRTTELKMEFLCTIIALCTHFVHINPLWKIEKKRNATLTKKNLIVNCFYIFFYFFSLLFHPYSEMPQYILFRNTTQSGFFAQVYGKPDWFLQSAQISCGITLLHEAWSQSDFVSTAKPNYKLLNLVMALLVYDLLMRFT